MNVIAISPTGPAVMNIKEAIDLEDADKQDTLDAEVADKQDVGKKDNENDKTKKQPTFLHEQP